MKQQFKLVFLKKYKLTIICITYLVELMYLPWLSLHAKQDEDYKALESFAKVLYYLETMYIDPSKVTKKESIKSALNGIISKLDPHSALLPSSAFEQLTIDTKGRFGGVGIIVSRENNKLIVISPIEGTPAYKAGIKSGDEIVKIDHKDLSRIDPNEAIDMMKGIPGSKIDITLIRNNKTMHFELKREVIKINAVTSRALSQDVDYIRIRSFQEETSKEIQSYLKTRGKKIKSLIIDLRDNPGGLLEQSVKTVDLFVDSGLIVSTIGRNANQVEREFAHYKDSFTNFPIIVLINEGSASASEIVAGALQDHKRAMILGTQSFGKGSVQTLISLPDGSGLKLTIARYYTPNGRSIQAKGISPDIYVSSKMSYQQKEKKIPRESDLRGHIESSDLKNSPKKGSLTAEIKKWPEFMRHDKQLVSAYTYLKGWTYFKPNSEVL